MSRQQTEAEGVAEAFLNILCEDQGYDSPIFWNRESWTERRLNRHASTHEYAIPTRDALACEGFEARLRYLDMHHGPRLLAQMLPDAALLEDKEKDGACVHVHVHESQGSVIIQYQLENESGCCVIA